MQLLEYFLGRLRGDGEFTFYRAHAKQIGPPSVLLPAQNSTRPSTEALEKIDPECSLRSELTLDWAVRPVALSERGAPITLVLEDPGGETLDGCLEAMEIKQFLGLAVGFTTRLEALHERELIHEGVEPTSFVLIPPTDQAGLMEFGIASRLRREHQAPEPPGFIAGTVPDMAPERKNRSIDSRSDAYALDGTFYEVLNGNLPFTASDPVQWVDCHIARHPVPPHGRAKSVPACVSAIVVKLDAKTPKERYQAAFGVESEFRRRVAEWEPHKFIADVSPVDEAADCLLILESLYGRARDLAIPLLAFGRALAGYSGIGESAVVNEGPKPVAFPQQQAERKRRLAGTTMGILSRLRSRFFCFSAKSELAPVGSYL